ncbi:MAG: hypothetical protein ABOK23_03845 [Candidatus Methanoperedens sp.]|nr:hypothetical protein [Candidatus Methanoperedens sp.]MCZ7394235.1 hypothetical protein [Candidatus Methanoperedens sp.]
MKAEAGVFKSCSWREDNEFWDSGIYPEVLLEIITAKKQICPPK